MSGISERCVSETLVLDTALDLYRLHLMVSAPLGNYQRVTVDGRSTYRSEPHQRSTWVWTDQGHRVYRLGETVSVKVLG